MRVSREDGETARDSDCVRVYVCAYAYASV